MRSRALPAGRIGQPSRAAAAGEITLEEAREFCALLETTELQVRIEALEQRGIEQ